MTEGTITIGLGLLFQGLDAYLRNRALAPLDEAERTAFLDSLEAASEAATAAEREALRAEIAAWRERLAKRES